MQNKKMWSLLEQYASDWENQNFTFKATTKDGVFWRKKGEVFLENILPNFKHGGGSIMLWGCVAAGGTGDFVRA